MPKVEQVIQRFILNEIMFSDDEASLSFSYPLLETGTLDSLDIQRLVIFLETQFNITVADDALLRDNFESVGAIADLVRRLQTPSDR